MDLAKFVGKPLPESEVDAVLEGVPVLQAWTEGWGPAKLLACTVAREHICRTEPNHPLYDGRPQELSAGRSWMVSVTQTFL
jgi:hypothetical protein